MGTATTKIIILCDKEEEFILTRDMLYESCGLDFEIDWTNSPKTAKDALFDGDYDVCLFECGMCFQQGLEFLKVAAANECRTPIVVLSEKDDRQSDIDAMKAGAADFLKKSQLFGPAFPNFIRTYSPFSFLPLKLTVISFGSHFNNSKVPLSQIFTVPAPYRPSGIFPSNLAYDRE